MIRRLSPLDLSDDVSLDLSARQRAKVIPFPVSAVAATSFVYRGYIVAFDPKPIPARCGVDWSWASQDYDGPGDRRCGASASLAEAKAAIDEIEDDGAEPELRLKDIAGLLAFALFVLAAVLLLGGRT